jgi:hypothetical protein
MAQQSKAGSFSAYLGAWEQRPIAAAPSGGALAAPVAAASSGSALAAPIAAASSASSMSLLQALAGADQKQMVVKDLQAASGMGFLNFADALRNLEQSGFLTLSGRPSAEIAKLTPLGEEVSRLAGSK